jgi:tetratricopeptide (TPR) repeat protein
LTLKSALPSPETTQRSQSPLSEAPNSISTLFGRFGICPTDASSAATRLAREPRAALNFAALALAISSAMPTSDRPVGGSRPKWILAPSAGDARAKAHPLLEEKAAVEQLSYDCGAAKVTLKQVLRLDPDRAASWIELGRIGQTTGALDDAAAAFKDGLAAARRSGNERDESLALNCVGDVLRAQGNLAGAMKSFRDALAIRHRLAQSDPGNAGWQHDLSVSYHKIGDVLKAQGNLAEAVKSFSANLEVAERRATGSRTSTTRPKRKRRSSGLSPSTSGC